MNEDQASYFDSSSYPSGFIFLDPSHVPSGVLTKFFEHIRDMEHPKDGSEPRYFRFRQVKENGEFVPAKYPPVLASAQKSRRSKTTVRRPGTKATTRPALSSEASSEDDRPQQSEPHPKPHRRQVKARNANAKGKGKGKGTRLPSTRKAKHDSDGLSIDELDAEDEESEDEDSDEPWQAMNDEESADEDEDLSEDEVPLQSAIHRPGLRPANLKPPHPSEDMEIDDENAVAHALEPVDPMRTPDTSSPGPLGVGTAAFGRVTSEDGLPDGSLPGPASAGVTMESRLNFLESLNGRVEFVSMLRRAKAQVRLHSYYPPPIER